MYFWLIAFKLKFNFAYGTSRSAICSHYVEVDNTDKDKLCMLTVLQKLMDSHLSSFWGTILLCSCQNNLAIPLWISYLKPAN